MAILPLTPNTVESLMQLVTMLALSLDPTLDAAAKAVRVGWQITGQPASSIDEDVAYVRCVEEDDQYNRIRDEQHFDAPPTQVEFDTTYTRVWRTFWTLYGPNSFDHARIIKSALFTQSIHDALLQAFSNYGELPYGLGGYGGSGVELYLVTDVIAPKRIPENFGGQWWERVDFDCQFNEGVTETYLVNAVVSSEVIIITDDGITVDEIVDAS
jgi:hypothetical protein